MFSYTIIYNINVEETNELQEKNKLSINEIEPIRESRDLMIKTRNDIKKFVELPLLPACEHLWDLNIRTVSTSANKNDIENEAYVNIDYDSLSEENKKIAQKIGEIYKNNDETSTLSFKIPITGSTTINDVRDATDLLFKQFKKQKATWIPSYSLQEIRKIYGYDSEDNTLGPEEFSRKGLFYDNIGNKFYLSEEHFKKTQDNID